MPTTIHYVYHLDASRDTVQSGDGATHLSAKASIRRAALCRKALMAQHGTALPDGSRPRAGRFRTPGGMSSRSTSEGIVFFPSRLPISWLDTDLPVTFCTDALLAAMLNTRALRGDRVWAALHHHCHSRRGPLIPEGINGYTLPPEVDAASYAEIIRRAIDSEEHYERLTMNVYEEFRQRLTGTLSAGSSSNLLEERVLRQSERRSPVGSSPALS